jgi:hypothetical protein
MAAVIGNTRLGPALTDLKPCVEAIGREVDKLGSKDTTTSNGTTVVFNSNSELDPKYFGWSQGDSHNDVLSRIGLNFSLLEDRILARKHGLVFGAQGGRLEVEWNHSESQDIDEEIPEKGVFREEVKRKRRVHRPFEESFAEIRGDLDATKPVLETALEDAGLTEPFSGLLETYLVPYSNAGNNSVPSALSSLNQSNQTFAAGFLSFESQHFRWRNVPLGEVSVGGRIGVLPVETLVSVSNDPNKKPNAYLQNAFDWNLNVRLSGRWGERMLATMLVSFGQNILLTNSSVLTPAAPSVSNNPPSNNTPANTTSAFGHSQSGATFTEIGPELRFYPYRLQRVDNEKRYLAPSFSLSTGLRLDERFSDLQQTQYGNFLKPTERLFLRTFVTLTSILERNPNSTAKASPFSAAIGFQYETPWLFPSSSRLVVPSSSGIFINASIDIVSAFSKQQSSK